MSIKRDYKSFDYILALLAISLSILGVVLIASATAHKSDGLSQEAKGQIMWVIVGIIILVTVALIDFQFICKFYIPCYIINIILLIVVLIYKTIKNLPLARSIPLGKAGSIQPSEFSKIFMIIFLSRFVDNNKEKINELPVLGATIGLTLIPVILIQRQPSLSASMVTLVILLVILFMSKLSYKYILTALAIVLPIVIFLYFDLNSETPFIEKIIPSYQLGRVTTFLDPDPNSKEFYQTKQSLRAIGSGQLYGKGLFNSTVLVPEAENDFIFSVLAQEFGFLGCSVVLLIMFIIILKCMLVAKNCNIFYGKLIASAIAGMFAFQVFVNVGVNTNLIPNTGMTFPFISRGGSSLWVCMACVGLVINIGMTKTKSMFED